MKLLIFSICVMLTSLPASAQNRYDIVIDEIMADPTPPVGLPNNEWIELRNTSATAINLQNWRIGDATSLSGPLPNFLLKPDSLVVICTSSAVAALSVFGATISVTSFPSLDNEGDQLYLRAPNGRIIHAVSYSSTWYHNDLKKDGGWSLEMIDTKNPCTGSQNWTASTHPLGGTPGKKNATDGINTDTKAPQVVNAYTTDNSTILLVFDEPVDRLSGATPAHYSINNGAPITGASTLSPLFNTVQLKLGAPLVSGTVYTVTASLVQDCKGNAIASGATVRTGLPAAPVSGEWVINEILFNPRTNGYDYVEFFNNSSKILDASRLYIANRNTSGAISSAKPLSAVPFYIFPGEYAVVTEDAANLGLNYLVQHPNGVFVIDALPSFPDDDGDVVTLDGQGNNIDEVKYDHHWHFKLLADEEGVSLERIDAAAPSNDSGNWHSAASSAGYGTPTYKNSQSKAITTADASITLSPLIFSPDNDGHDDILSIAYHFDEPGLVATITVFDAAGHPVRNLVSNAICGTSGYWNWDGLSDTGARLPVGHYIIFTRLFSLGGKKKTDTQTVTLARRIGG